MKFTSAIKREVQGKDDTYTVELTSVGVYIRIKGTRTTYGPVSWDSIYFTGGKLQAFANIREQGDANTTRRRRVLRSLLP